MAHLHPYPFRNLVTRMLRELDEQRTVFDLPERKFFLGSPLHDISVPFHDQTASSPLGPAAGPQSQMAQNLVLAWLGGCRIHELKTVQILDELTIPRPCIDMQTVGFNVEWSQELKLEQSLEEYVKGAMLIEILRSSGALKLEAGFDRTVYDMSVGYDLAGIQSPRVLEFIRGMKDSTAIVDRLRREIPAPYARFRDLDFPTKLSRTLTLSTFHGCPPREIERIVDVLLRNENLHCIVKLNPTLLGPRTVRELLHDQLGYTDLEVPESAFEKDTQWPQAEEFVERLGETARSRGLGFGVKFSNTLIVRNHRAFFPATETEMYLSGPPLHVLAMHLVGRFRERFGDRYPISFSAGIDRANFADAVALGLTPVTVCSDLLKPGGYGRAEAYFRDLTRRMDSVGARTVDEWILRAYGSAPGSAPGPAPTPEEVSEARLRNTRTYVQSLAEEPRYRLEQNRKSPRKIGSHLSLFDCVSCDKCIPVCPNDANFTFVIPATSIPIVKLRRSAAGTWDSRTEGSLTVEMKHQIGNVADFCNECGNCDVFCPEDGGPYLIKPRFFLDESAWRTHPELDGFWFGEPSIAHARVSGLEYAVGVEAEALHRYEGPGFSIALDLELPPTRVEGTAEGEIDLTWFHITRWVWNAVRNSPEVNYVNAGFAPAT